MSLLKLRLSMVGTLAFIISVSTLFFAIILSLTGTFDPLFLAFLIVFFNIIQWLIAPYLIDALYRVRQVSRSEEPRLYEMVERLSLKIRMNMPKVMIAQIPIPNAFAYGSPIAGSRVAVTTGLLRDLEDEEVEAVIGHELGHLKHRDVQIMMFASVLPAIFYWIGHSLLLSYRFQRRDGGSSAAMAIGAISILLYWVLMLFVLHLSRLREYYADRRSAAIVEDGPRKLSEALAKIVTSTGRMTAAGGDVSRFDEFKTLFISDPDHSTMDYVQLAQMRMFTADRRLVDQLLSRKVTLADRIAELFSTHPNIVLRLKALQKL